jgi:hypothetical protein
VSEGYFPPISAIKHEKVEIKLPRSFFGKSGVIKEKEPFKNTKETNPTGNDKHESPKWRNPENL